MPNPATRQLLRRHAVAFAVSFVSLTALLLAKYAVKQLPQLGASGVRTATIVEALLLAVPFTAAMTIPMAVFLAVLWVFTRLGAEGALAQARRERDGVRRLVAPVLGAAAVVAAMTLVLNAQIVPRANERLAAIIAGGAPERANRMMTDRTMTIGELREAVQSARADAGPDALARASYYEVEVQKKYALAAASLVLALAGAAIALRFPRGGARLVIGASSVVFTAYYACLITGEALADRMVISPFIAMWGANALLVAAALLALWRSGLPRAPRGAESLAIGG
jgi:lipopolysaccharide export LptBFGC system permease protein LptF